MVTFFGHRDAPEEIRFVLYSILEQMIEEHDEILFLVGNRGRFDRMVLREIKMIKQRFPRIVYHIVLSGFPKGGEISEEDLQYTLVADGCEECPPKFAIVRCNRWLVEKADLIITYVTHNFGGAATFQKEGKRKGKKIINLADCAKK